MKRGAMLAVVALIAVAFMVCYAYTVSIGVKAEWSRAAPAGGYGDLNNDGTVTFTTESSPWRGEDNWLLLAFYDTYGPWDVNQDGIVNDGDVDEITGAWTGEFEPYYTRADVSCDGRVNVIDIYIVTKFWNQTTTPAMTEQRIAQIATIGNIPLTAAQAIERGDVNDDGVLSIEDFRLIIQYAKGEIDAFPVENGGNTPPVAILSQSHYNVTAYNPLLIDASSSYDPDGTIVSWRWMVSDGYDSGWIANMPTLTYTWEDIPFGTTKQYHVEVQVKDDYGDVSSASATVWVKGAIPPDNNPPVVIATISPPVGIINKDVVIDATASYDPDGDSLQYKLLIPYPDHIDSITWQNSPVFNYKFTQSGTYHIEVYVKDSHGAQSKEIYSYTVRDYVILTVYLNPHNNLVHVDIIPYVAEFHYPIGTSVTLRAYGDEFLGGRYTFSHWEGDLTGTENPVTITMDSDKTITAMFEKEYVTKYKLNVVVASTDGHLNVGDVHVVPYYGDWMYPEGTEVSLTAIPNEGYYFSHWDGSLTGSQNPISLTMNSDKNVIAYFTANTYTLTVNVVGGGSVTPSGGVYSADDVVTLTAIPNNGWVFDHWSGDAVGSTNPTTVIMNSDKEITAVFVEEQPMQYTLTLHADPPEGGTVVVIGVASASQHPAGSIVTISAIPNNGYTFKGWTGTTGDATTTVTMNSDMTVTAHFEKTRGRSLLFMIAIIVGIATGAGIVYWRLGKHG